MTRGLDFKAANEAEKLGALTKRLGEEVTLKLLCVVIKIFSDTVRSKDKLRSSEIIETADQIMLQYKLESLEDIVLAFKQARLKGKEFYHGLDGGKIFSVINEYLEEKADWRMDEEYRKRKALDSPLPDDILEFDQKAWQDNMALVRAEIEKVKNARKLPSVNTSQSKFRELLVDQLPFMSNENLYEARKSYLSAAKDHKWEIDLIEAELDARNLPR